MPRPTKPRALKLLEGTARPDRLRDEPEFEVTNDAQPPYPLRGPIAVAEWQRVVPLLESQGVITEVDLAWLCVAVNCFDAIQERWQSGESPTGSMLQQWRSLAEGLGMSPSSRAKVQRVSVAKEPNPFVEDSRIAQRTARRP